MEIYPLVVILFFYLEHQNFLIQIWNFLNNGLIKLFHNLSHEQLSSFIFEITISHSPYNFHVSFKSLIFIDYLYSSYTLYSVETLLFHNTTRTVVCKVVYVVCIFLKKLVFMVIKCCIIIQLFK